MSNRLNVVAAAAAFTGAVLVSSLASAGSYVTFSGSATRVLDSSSGIPGLLIGEPASGFIVDGSGGTIAAVPTAVNGNRISIPTVTITGATDINSLVNIGANHLVVVAPDGSNNVTVNGNTYTLPNDQFIQFGPLSGGTATGTVYNGFNALPAAIVAASQSGVYSGVQGLTSSLVEGTYTTAGGGTASYSSYCGIGYVNNSTLATPYTTFGSDTNVPTDALLIAPAYIGDYNLSGDVTMAGYYAWAKGYSIIQSGGTIPASELWEMGDYLNQGTVTMADYYAWANAYAAEQAGLLPALPTGVSGVWSVPAVPEPGTFALLAVAAAGLLGYAWRRKRT